jgi:hypothetical protein
MLPEMIRFAAAADIGLTVAEGTGRFQGILPLAGSHPGQIGLVLGAAVLLYELALLIRAAHKHVRAGIRRGKARGTAAS